MKNRLISCPICASKEIEVPGHIVVGDLVRCKNCEGEFIVVSLKPFEIRAVDEDLDEGENDSDMYDD